jgi:ubiquinone biosynthesis protein COQ4
MYLSIYKILVLMIFPLHMMIIQKYVLLLKSLYGVVRLSRNPKNTNYVFLIGNSQDALAEDYRKQKLIDDPFDNPSTKLLLDEQYHSPKYDLDKLELLSSNTLGHIYATHMKKNQLDPEFYNDVKPISPMHYLRLRIRKTHDIWHVINGFDTSENGEMGLQGVYFAQFSNGQSAMILMGGILKSLFSFNYIKMKEYIDNFVKGYNIGKKALPLLPVKWEEKWNIDINQLRQEFDIKL